MKMTPPDALTRAPQGAVPADRQGRIRGTLAGNASSHAMRVAHRVMEN